jgi:hypothetical protein
MAGRLEVCDIVGSVFRLAATAVPIKLHGVVLLEDDAARELVRELAEAQRSDPGMRSPPAGGRPTKRGERLQPLFPSIPGVKW